MANNPFKGQKELKIGDKTYTLIFDLNALAELQQKLEISGINELLSKFEQMDFITLRTILWAGLLHEFMDEKGEYTIHERQVGTWIGRDITLLECTSILSDALQRAVGEDKEVKGKNPNQAKGKAAAASQ